MLTYNTHLKSLIMPEYGRNIHKMVEHCIEIEDRQERTRCANTIIDCMLALFPTQQKQEEYKRKLWDHLAIMSDFRLDVDLPFELPHAEERTTAPQPVPYHNGIKGYRIYGDNLLRMVKNAAAMEESQERDALILLLANQMKKNMLAVNPEGVPDRRIFKDLYEITDGAIRLTPEETTLFEFKEADVPGKKKKKK